MKLHENLFYAYHKKRPLIIKILKNTIKQYKIKIQGGNDEHKYRENNKKRKIIK